MRRKWTFKRIQAGGRPRTAPEIEACIVQMARENPRWGYDRIQGELLKLGVDLDPTTVANIMRRHRIPPAPDRGRSTWRAFLHHYKQQMLACDFFTVETVWLRTVYVLFFIELDTRRVHFVGCTRHPTLGWITQQARQLIWKIEEVGCRFRFLIRDRDKKFARSFDSIFRSVGIEIIQTPFRALKANAFAERWIRSVRQECLGHILIINEGHLQRVLTEYVAFYNTSRPHQGIDQRTPIHHVQHQRDGPIRRRDLLGGIIHDYYREAA